MNKFLRILLMLLVIYSFVPVMTSSMALPKTPTKGVMGNVATKHMQSVPVATNPPQPFLYRPYYGNQSIAQRTVSFVDHDKPWYVNDGIFVRYDGLKWTNVSIGSCTGGVNCYDGHNGYDLNLWYEPVLSAAAGTVIRAGWYNPLDHNSSLGLWAAVDHGNGYVTAYGHLSALLVSVGQQVGIQWQLGTSGTTGSSTGPHLHMATYYLPYWQATDPFGWTGNYPDPNVVPDNYLWVANPGSTGTVPELSANGSALAPGAILVDDSSAGWSSTGNWSLASTSSDIGGSMHWTTTTSGNATASATWQPTLTANGYYEVGTFVDDNHASSSWASYTVYSADPNHVGNVVAHPVVVDQSHIGTFQGPFSWENTGAQWISLGTYYFQAGQSARVTLSNATGENGVQLGADGVEFVPVSVQATPPPPSYNFTVTSDNTPSIAAPASTQNVTLILKNSSNFSWLASGVNAVQVIYRWLNAQGQTLAVSSGIALPQDVNASDSVTLTVAVQMPTQTGNYTLQWDMSQGSTLFSQQGAQTYRHAVSIASAYSESLSIPSLSPTLTPGATFMLPVTVRNTGSMAWSAMTTGHVPHTTMSGGLVQLGYQWLDSAGQPLAAAQAIPTTFVPLSTALAPGSSTTLTLTLHAPVLAGNYQLRLDMVQPGAQGGPLWFTTQGATPLIVPLTIAANLPDTYYFAEGYTGAGSSESLALTNLSTQQATITITYLYQNAVPLVRTYQLGAQVHRVLDISQEAGANQSLSMIVHGDQPFVAERTMLIQKGSFVAASDSVGSTSLSTHWYFADGNTNFGWNTLLAVLNPSTQPTTLTINYLPTPMASNQAQPASQRITIPALARASIVLNSIIPNRQFGMAISASVPVLVERPEYLIVSPLRGGSSVVGASAPQQMWYFGAGNTTSGFTERVILANPNSQSVNVQIRYLLPSGQTRTQQVSVAGLTRSEVNVNAAIGQTQHAIIVSANLPIVAERSDFFSTYLNSAVVGSSVAIGSSAVHTSWYVTEGTSSNGYQQTLALANPNTLNVQVQVVYYTASGVAVLKTYTVPALARFTIMPANDMGVGQQFGMAIYATLPIVVEQHTLFSVQGASGGYSSMALGA